MHGVQIKVNYLLYYAVSLIMQKGRRGRRTKAMIDMAGERIDILFDLAEEEAKVHKFHRANRYVDLARKIGMRYNVRVPSQYKRRYCKFCHSYLVPSVNSRVRVRNNKIVVSCDNCGGIMRMPFVREDKEKKKD
jgi:ribonuclease P protein subunit RPR2